MQKLQHLLTVSILALVRFFDHDHVRSDVLDEQLHDRADMLSHYSEIRPRIIVPFLDGISFVVKCSVTFELWILTLLAFHNGPAAMKRQIDAENFHQIKETPRKKISG